MNRTYSDAAGGKSRGQLFRFLLVGSSNFAISSFVFYSFLHLPELIRPSIFFIQLLSYSVGTIWSFFWNRKYTFRSSDRPLGEAARFIMLQCSLALLSAVIIEFLVNSVHIRPFAAWFLVMFGVTAANYLLSRHWAFRT